MIFIIPILKKDDVFMCLDLDKHDEFVRIHALYDTCELCGSSEEFIIPYCHSEKWICNNCIIDDIEYHMRQYNT